MKNIENEFRSGFVCIVGKPNVGKSTLINALIGEKVAIVSNKPQTTRNKITAILTEKDCQIIILDTPGIHSPKSKLGEYMFKTAVKNMDGVDAILFVVEPEKPRENDILVLENTKKTKTPVFLLINKIDTIAKEQLLSIIDTYKSIRDFKEIIPISALNGSNLDLLLNSVKSILPLGPLYYDEDLLTDQPERQIVAELIREKALISLDKEIPHGIAVMVDSMKPRENRDLIDIEATIFCEKNSHKQIVIGSKGSMLRKIGASARADIEAFLGTQVFLNLWVKVKKDWRDNDMFIKGFGFDKKNI